MVRRNESDETRQVREAVKARQEAETRAYTEFFGVQDRRAQLLAEIGALEVEQFIAVAAIVAASDVARTADTIGWSHAKVREAVNTRHGDGAVGSGDVHTATEVAS